MSTGHSSTTDNKDFLGHRKRIKKRYSLQGFEGWSDYEILELVLSYSVVRKDTKKVAKVLVSEFGGLVGVLNADLNKLQKIAGISEHSALLIKMFKDVSDIYTKHEIFHYDALSSPGKVVNYFKSLLKGAQDEELHAIYLNAINHPIGVEKLQKGTVNRASVFPRQVAEGALLKKASGAIIVHNHPGGSLEPSENDISSTEAVRRALSLVDVILHDHIIICGNNYCSMKAKGYIA